MVIFIALDSPKEEIQSLSEALLETFREIYFDKDVCCFYCFNPVKTTFAIQRILKEHSIVQSYSGLFETEGGVNERRK